jgi:hypothetical protein
MVSNRDSGQVLLYRDPPLWWIRIPNPNPDPKPLSGSKTGKILYPRWKIFLTYLIENCDTFLLYESFPHFRETFNSLGTTSSSKTVTTFFFIFFLPSSGSDTRFNTNKILCYSKRVLDGAEKSVFCPSAKDFVRNRESALPLLFTTGSRQSPCRLLKGTDTPLSFATGSRHSPMSFAKREPTLPCRLLQGVATPPCRLLRSYNFLRLHQ